MRTDIQNSLYDNVLVVLRGSGTQVANAMTGLKPSRAIRCPLLCLKARTVALCYGDRRRRVNVGSDNR